MSAYPDLEQIQDPAARAAMRVVFDRLAAAETAGNAQPTYVAPTAAVAGTGSQRVTNLADPQQRDDAVNKRTLRLVLQTMVNDALKRVGVPHGITARV